LHLDTERSPSTAFERAITDFEPWTQASREAWTDALRAGYAYLQEHGKVGCQALVKDVYSEHTTGCSNSRAWWRYILSDRTFDNLRRDRRPAECITASVR